MLEKLTKHRSQKIFYGMFLLSVVVAILGFTLTVTISDTITEMIGSSDPYFSVDTFLIGFAFCLMAWVFIIGIFFIPKNWLVITISLLVLIPHVFFIVIMYAYSLGFSEIFRMYIHILSFGFINI